MRWIQASLAVTVLAAVGAAGTPQAAQSACWTGAELTSEQKARRSQLIGLARDISNQQLSAMQKGKSYRPMSGLTLSRPVPDGVEIKLAADAEGYSFSIVDKTDECRSGVFSNDAGLIYTGQVIR